MDEGYVSPALDASPASIESIEINRIDSIESIDGITSSQKPQNKRLTSVGLVRKAPREEMEGEGIPISGRAV